MTNIHPHHDYRDDMALDAREMELDRQLRRVYRREQRRFTAERIREFGEGDCPERTVKLVGRAA
jgi:hypothetical protein